MDRVFTLSARDYADMKSVELSDYEPKFVEAFDDTNTKAKRTTAISKLDSLCDEIGAEAIVDVHPTIFVYDPGNYTEPFVRYLAGTALIPKKKGDE